MQIGHLSCPVSCVLCLDAMSDSGIMDECTVVLTWFELVLAHENRDHIYKLLWGWLAHVGFILTRVLLYTDCPLCVLGKPLDILPSKLRLNLYVLTPTPTWPCYCILEFIDWRYSTKTIVNSTTWLVPYTSRHCLRCLVKQTAATELRHRRVPVGPSGALEEKVIPSRSIGISGSPLRTRLQCGVASKLINTQWWKEPCQLLLPFLSSHFPILRHRRPFRSRPSPIAWFCQSINNSQDRATSVE